MLTDNQNKILETIKARALDIAEGHEGESGYFEGNCPQMSEEDILVVQAFLPLGISIEGDEIVIFLDPYIGFTPNW